MQIIRGALMVKTLPFQSTCNSRPQKIKMRPKAYSRLFGIALGSSLGVIFFTLTFHGSRVIYVEDSNEVIPSDQIRGVPIHFQNIDFNATAHSDDEDIMDVLYRHNDTEHKHGKSMPLLFGLKSVVGAQWLSGRVLDSRLRGCGFEPHRCHCVVVLEQDTFILA